MDERDPSKGGVRVPDAGARAEARRKPGGWVYVIAGGYGPDDATPPQAIQGAWKADDRGEIVGDFILNPRFDPDHRK